MTRTTQTTLTITNMTKEEENYWRGYIDAKVEDIGKVRTHHPSTEQKIEHRDKLMKKYGII
jgi:hypothetical protein